MYYVTVTCLRIIEGDDRKVRINIHLYKSYFALIVNELTSIYNIGFISI